MPPTIAAEIGRALATLEALATRGEEIEDEWQYVTDLHAVWRDRLIEVAALRGTEALSSDRERAIGTAIAAAERIEDPHRVIDWLSTFPQVALLALGEAG
ncbi:MAG TPA: hypothetical protein VKA85_00750 [Candidatus Limnocylindrales bacterium]|nr:hypothetical protein [Candidatus Limnocylindrales bacterium]